MTIENIRFAEQISLQYLIFFNSVSIRATCKDDNLELIEEIRLSHPVKPFPDIIFRCPALRAIKILIIGTACIVQLCNEAILKEVYIFVFVILRGFSIAYFIQQSLIPIIS